MISSGTALTLNGYQVMPRLRCYSFMLPVANPANACRYLDEGGNPDTYTAEAFRHSLQSNQLSKGKVDAIKSFR